VLRQIDKVNGAHAKFCGIKDRMQGNGSIEVLLDI
jgi:hypothetical protein